MALRENPGGTGGPALPFHPFALHPDRMQFPNESPQGVLRQAPYSFRTLTGGVQAYLSLLQTQYGKWYADVIIHCLPGLYGPTGGTPSLPVIDPGNGLPYNGENWPFLLPWYASIQGASALDTILDARGRETTVLVLEAAMPQQLSHVNSIVDSLTVRGARSNAGPMSPQNSTGAGILIARGAQIQATISNCFLVDNDVGLAIDNPAVADPFVTNRPRIINNTFARNRIGLWNGSRNPLEVNEGRALPILLNNVFDSWHPTLSSADTTPFVGVDARTISVGRIYTPSGGPIFIPPISYCAWEAGRGNRVPTNQLPNWPAPTSVSPVLPPPRVDIGPYTGVNTGVRGILFLNDVMRRAPAIGAGVEYSGNDFRLSPNVSMNAAPPLANGAALNPLVNRGVYVWQGSVQSPSIWRIDMASIVVDASAYVTYAPGPDPNGEPNAVLHCWDLDCEGFGNPRAVARSGGWVVGSIENGDTALDLGADEMDELIMGGFVDRTRIFTQSVVGAPTVPPRLPVFFFNVNFTASTWPRPRHNAILGDIHTWFNHVQAPSDALPGSNYTGGAFGTLRWTLWQNAGKPPFMRNLQCDFSPHLLADPHPMWPTVFGDEYAANPWWWHDLPDGTQPPGFPYDNAALYDNIAATWPDHGGGNLTVPAFNLPRTTVISGTINPPGSIVTGSQYLHPAYPLAQFGPFSACGTSTYRVNQWGYGDLCVDSIPYIANKQWYGVRYNCQIAGGTEVDPVWQSNLQTFLGVNGVPVLEEGVAQEPTPVGAARHGAVVEREIRR